MINGIRYSVAILLLLPIQNAFGGCYGHNIQRLKTYELEWLQNYPGIAKVDGAWGKCSVITKYRLEDSFRPDENFGHCVEAILRRDFAANGITAAAMSENGIIKASAPLRNHQSTDLHNDRKLQSILLTRINRAKLRNPELKMLTGDLNSKGSIIPYLVIADPSNMEFLLLASGLCKEP